MEVPNVVCSNLIGARCGAHILRVEIKSKECSDSRQPDLDAELVEPFKRCVASNGRALCHLKFSCTVFVLYENNSPVLRLAVRLLDGACYLLRAAVCFHCPGNSRNRLLPDRHSRIGQQVSILNRVGARVPV